MMNLFLLVTACFTISTCHSLMCYECNNAKSNEECLLKGKLNKCTVDDAVCENQVRHSNNGEDMLIEKRCKQSLACTNNEIQNPRSATPTQCFITASSSVCRCCCGTDGCNLELNCNDTNGECPEQGPLVNGEFSCTNGKNPGSVCTWTCNQNFTLYPNSTFGVNTCLNNGKWDKPWPCCTTTEICSPGNLVANILILVDSSNSVGRTNFETTKVFVRSLFEQFTLSPDAAQFSFFQYNIEVRTGRDGINFNNYTRNKTAFLEAFDQISYQGFSQTNTGRALSFTLSAFQNASRRRAPETLLLITDGTSRDDPVTPANLLRSNGVDVIVIPVQPTSNRPIDLRQMAMIAGREENLIREALNGGFEALNVTFAQSLAERLCPSPCSNPFSTNLLERQTPRRLQNLS